MNRPVELPNEIDNMVHLKFLSLQGSRITGLPSSLGNLICLQTVDFRFSNTQVVPNVIWKMEQLRHLYLPLYWTAHPKLRLSTLHNLQTLDHVSSLCCDLKDLTLLTNLRKLGIRVTSSLESLEETLKCIRSTLDRIRSLFVHNLLGIRSGTEVTQIVLSCRNIYKLDLIGRTIELPEDLHHYPNLTKLTLCRCDLKDNQMAVLEKLPNLKSLCLMEETFEYKNTKTLVFSKGGFPHLECLKLICIREAEDLKVVQGAMPSLCRLYIARCERSKTIPDGLRYVTTLKKLSIRMPSSFTSRLQVGGEDYYKIQHVPSVEFANF
ncbi:hypothetical protein M0R45_021439 [Rubus argutus]|uniref:Disease resistance R13L4/SHOC-2-like LRR domain-containing protein n=1 Tax=Rubus argutus TaxID=59490 RepID=A0AAW1XDP2_RUBAR